MICQRGDMVVGGRMSPRFIWLGLALIFTPVCSAADVDWSGPYLGAFVGYAEANDAWDDSAAPGAPQISPEGIMLGGFAGYAHDAQPLI